MEIIVIFVGLLQQTRREWAGIIIICRTIGAGSVSHSVHELAKGRYSQSDFSKFIACNFLILHITRYSDSYKYICLWHYYYWLDIIS